MRLLGRLLVLMLALAGCASTDTRATDWNFVSAERNEVEVVAAVGSSSCNSRGDVNVTSTQDYVELTVDVVTSDDQDCTADDSVATVKVELDGPLGDRELRGCRPDDPAGFPLDPREVPPEGCRGVRPD